jgi:hypothetical protein
MTTTATQLNSKYQNILNNVSRYLGAMQTRERLLALAAISALIVIATVEGLSIVSDKLDSQERRLQQVLNDVDLVSAGLFRHKNLKSRLNAIEDSYKEVQFDATEAYFERLIKQKAGIVNSKDFSIRSRPSKDFGGGFKQTSFFIKFTISDPKRLIEFLKELAQGPKPVIISKIDIKPRKAKDALDVEIEIASIKKTKE